MLGRTGDILNIIPAVEYEAKQNGYKPKVISAEKYADVLDGFDFLEKIIFPGDFTDTSGAILFAHRNHHYEKLITCAVYGKNYKVDKKCSSFLREAWRLSQCPEPWGKLPLRVTSRDSHSEDILLHELPVDIYRTSKKIILTALSGTSSPFQHRELLLTALNEKLGEEHIILDISDIKARRIYDLLAIYERAKCLIAIDSAPLHLAKAVPDMPVISLISDLKDEWHQSSWTKQHAARILYSEVPGKLEEIVCQINDPYYNKPEIHLVTTSSRKDEEVRRRDNLALQSWFQDRRLSGADNYYIYTYEANGAPKVSSLIEHAYERTKNENDIIIITNADICFVPGTTGWILHEVERHGAVYFHRHDFQRIEQLFTSEHQVASGKWYPGSDTFAFTKKWWQDHRDIFPDMYFAREFWDMIFRNMIKRSGGTEIHNAIYHEKHPSFWESKENRNCQENLHNKALAQRWLETYGGDWNDWKYKLHQLRYK